MSAFTIINDIALELRRRTFEAMRDAVGVSLGFSDEVNNIVLDPPKESSEAGTRLYLYLYHVGINNVLRNQELLRVRERDDELRLPPLPLELKFLVAPAADEENNQLILGRFLQFIYDTPSINSINGALLGDSFGGASKALRLTPDLLNVEQLSQLWNAFSQPYRLSMAFQVDVVAIDSARMPIVAPRVVETISVARTKELNE